MRRIRTNRIVGQRCEFVVRTDFPQPIGSGCGIVAELRFAFPQCLLGALAVAHVDDKDDPLVCLSLEKCAPDHNWDAAPVFAVVLLLVMSATSAPPPLTHRT